MFHSIEICSGLKITGIVNNTNLLGDTSINDLLEGNDIIGKAAERLGVPIAFTSGFYKVLQELDRLKDSNNLDDMLYMEKMIRLPWEKTENR